jgi:hypothetical protein
MNGVSERVEQGSAAGGTAACEAVGEFCGVLLGPCGQPSIGLYRHACVHEHVRDGHLCQGHVDRQKAGLCRTCLGLVGGLSHECPINVTQVTA